MTACLFSPSRFHAYTTTGRLLLSIRESESNATLRKQPPADVKSPVRVRPLNIDSLNSSVTGEGRSGGVPEWEKEGNARAGGAFYIVGYRLLAATWLGALIAATVRRAREVTRGYLHARSPLRVRDQVRRIRRRLRAAISLSCPRGPRQRLDSPFSLSRTRARARARAIEPAKSIVRWTLSCRDESPFSLPWTPSSRDRYTHLLRERREFLANSLVSLRLRGKRAFCSLLRCWRRARAHH